MREAGKQNQEYFHLKARELIARSTANKHDIVSKASANLLFKSLSISKEEILEKYPNFTLKETPAQIYTPTQISKRVEPVEEISVQNPEEETRKV